MKANNYALLFFFSFMLSLSSAMATGPRVTERMLHAVENEMFAVDAPPFASLDLPDSGLNVAIVKTALKAVGMNATVTILPVAKMVEYYLYEEQGLGAFADALDLTKANRKSFIFVPVFHAKMDYFYFKGKHPSGLGWKGSLKDLKGLTYGACVKEDVSAHEKAGVKVKVIRRCDLPKALLEGEVDFIRMPSLAMTWKLDKEFAKHKGVLAAAGDMSGWMPVFVAFNKKHADAEKISKKLKQGLLSILDNGQYADILKKYLPDEKDVAFRVDALRKSLHK